MAKLTWDATRGFDYRDIDFSLLFEGVNTVATSQRYILDYGSGDRDEFRGHGFTYDFEGLPVGGTITSYSGMEGWLRTVRLDGVKISVSSLVKAASTFSTSDDRALIKKALSGNDVITGDFWDDRLDGFAGKDKITGSLGADKLYGGSGADAFIYTRTLDSFGDVEDRSSMDTIFDFSSRQKDKIDLRKIDANETLGGNQGFHWIGTADFGEQAGELRFERAGGGVHVETDADGDGIADLTIFLRGISAMSKGDFYL
jgi:Ca2+-binding RTX toxin-like protein